MMLRTPDELSAEPLGNGGPRGRPVGWPALSVACSAGRTETARQELVAFRVPPDATPAVGTRVPTRQYGVVRFG